MSEQDIAAHYTHGDLLTAIRDGLAKLGKTMQTVTVDDLAPVDEFHIGGRQASADFLGQLGLTPDDHVLDVGCGLGGGARFVASHYGSRVTGIDLTAEYVETGEALCAWLELSDRITLQEGSALALPFEDGVFDAAFMLHLGMNIEDKRQLCTDVCRVVRPGACFGIYDVMRVGDGDLAYPVPWAATQATSAVRSPQDYRAALEEAGFTVTAERNRRDFALAFFAQLKADNSAATGAPPLGLHILMGEGTPTKLANMIANIESGALAPVEIVARKRGSD